MKALMKLVPQLDATEWPTEAAVASGPTGAKPAPGATRTWRDLPDNGCNEPVSLVADLGRLPTPQAHGRVAFEAKEPGGEYWLTAELTVPFNDFARFEIDPEGGFNDERVVLGIPKLGFAVDMTFERIDAGGAVFVAGDGGDGLCVEPGDTITVEINGKEAAAGVF